MQVRTFSYGVFGTLRDLMGAEELLVAFYDEPELVHDMMDHLTSVWLAVWRSVAAQVQIDLKIKWKKADRMALTRRCRSALHFC